MGSRFAGLMAVGLVASHVALAEDAPDWGAEVLSGDWGGARSSLYDKGVTVELTHKSDAWSNVSGGVARGGVVLMNSEAAVTLDMDKLAGWGGGERLRAISCPARQSVHQQLCWRLRWCG